MFFFMRMRDGFFLTETCLKSIVAALAVLRVADSRATCRAECAADQGTLKAASTLVANNAADSGSAETADDRATLGIRT
jgi:hypothetical protein